MEEKILSAPVTLEKARPWYRFWARSFDLLVHTLIIVIIWTLLHEESINSIPNGVFTVLISFAWIFIEWLYMVLYGTTPGKKILGIQVSTTDGSRLSPNLSFKRARLVWLRGMGVGVGIVQLIANIIGYSNLKRDNTTTWDRELQLIINHKQIGIIRMLICPLIVIGMILLATVDLFIS